MFSLLAICLLFVAVAGQPHADGVSCYNCGGPGPDHELPGCMNHVRHCHGNEICQINYGGHRTEVRCHRREECTRQVHQAHRQCSTGGASVHDSCQICCEDDACVTDAINKVSSTGANSMGVHCPNDCALDNLAACLPKGHVCGEDEFCKVSKDETNNHMHGKCEDKPQLHHCQDEVADHHCDPHHHKCVMGCCFNDSCVAQTFGATTTDLWELLKGDCQDQLPSSQCAALDASEHLCNDRLALRVCPKTCGLCSAFNMSACTDTVFNDGCKTLVTAEDICSKHMALYMCPVTCNMCDALLEEKIKEAMANNRVTTMAPVGSVGTTHDPNLVTCSDLANEDCAVVNVMCLTINCPDVCNNCASGGGNVATTALPGGTASPMITSALPVATSALPMATSALPMATSALPVDTSALHMDTTSARPLYSSPLPEETSVPHTIVASSVLPSSGTCEDTIIGMNCADVQDVCSSSLLIDYCKKFCNICP